MKHCIMVPAAIGIQDSSRLIVIGQARWSRGKTSALVSRKSWVRIPPKLPGDIYCNCFIHISVSGKIHFNIPLYFIVLYFIVLYFIVLYFIVLLNKTNMLFWVGRRYYIPLVLHATLPTCTILILPLYNSKFVCSSARRMRWWSS